MQDILKKLRESGFKPEVNEDKGFEPVNGKYVCRIDSAGRVQGKSPKTGDDYDFYSVNAQVIEIVDGDKATNRFLRLRYNNTEDGIKKLLNDLFTAGIEAGADSQDELDTALPQLTDKTMNIRAWVWRPDKDMQGNPIPEDERRNLQSLRVVKEFKGKTKPDTATTDVPF